MMDKILKKFGSGKDDLTDIDNKAWKQFFEDLNEYGNIENRDFIESFLMKESK